jgi:hypothetical protein
MIRVIGSLLVLSVLGGLFFVYRDSRSLEARSKALTNPNDDSLIAPPNWKVTSASNNSTSRSAVYGARPNSIVASSVGYGGASPSGPPLWSRRGVKLGSNPTYMPRDRTAEPPKAVLLPFPMRQSAPMPAPTQALVAVPARSRGTDAVASDEMRGLLSHARFLIKAGLSPMAREPLQQIMREAPGTSVAREARLTLDTLRN